MCLACEEQQYFFQAWCAGFLARGEMPPGVTAEDLEAMGMVLPASLGGSTPSSPQASTPPAASSNPFACDSPDE
ncbi:MAG: hypothetical protein IT537_13615 [Hyphomicrobiales bacterium]|nr:hypothetical protein [Hyphomicrobiales bacterium]